MWAAQYLHFNCPRHWLTSGGLGAMGFGLPAALGAQAAHPGKTVIDIDGDGSFLMNIQELACAFTEKLPVKVLLLNNQHLGMVVQWEDRFHDGNRGHTYLGAGHDEEPYPDFVTLAKGFRCGAGRVSQKDDLDAALEEMLDSKGPYVLDVMVPYQEHVLPMIPSGRYRARHHQGITPSEGNPKSGRNRKNQTPNPKRNCSATGQHFGVGKLWRWAVTVWRRKSRTGRFCNRSGCTMVRIRST